MTGAGYGVRSDGHRGRRSRSGRAAAAGCAGYGRVRRRRPLPHPVAAVHRRSGQLLEPAAAVAAHQHGADRQSQVRQPQFRSPVAVRHHVDQAAAAGAGTQPAQRRQVFLQLIWLPITSIEKKTVDSVPLVEIFMPFHLQPNEGRWLIAIVFWFSVTEQPAAASALDERPERPGVQLGAFRREFAAFRPSAVLLPAYLQQQSKLARRRIRWLDSLQRRGSMNSLQKNGKYV